MRLAYAAAVNTHRSPIKLFLYLDYRQFLRDWYAQRKARRGGYSFRAFSQRAGFQSPNFFKLVMDGDRNLTAESLEKFMVGLELNKQEQTFFRNLVLMNQAKTSEAQALAYQRLLQSRKFGQLKPLEKSQYEYYATWYHAVIREMVVSPEFDGTVAWLAERIVPRLSIAQIEKSLALLETLQMLQRTSEGRWRQTRTLVTTGPEVESVVLLNYHRRMLELASTVLSEVPANQRDFSTLTLGIVRSRVPELKQKIREFRQEILQMVATDEQPESVVQLNMQFFPLTVQAGENLCEDEKK